MKSAKIYKNVVTMTTPMLSYEATSAIRWQHEKLAPIEQLKLKSSLVEETYSDNKFLQEKGQDPFLRRYYIAYYATPRTRIKYAVRTFN